MYNPILFEVFNEKVKTKDEKKLENRIGYASEQQEGREHFVLYG